MMNKVLIIFAQFAEAKSLIEQTGATAVEGIYLNIWSEGLQPSLYQFTRGFIVLCGLGIHSAQMAAAKYAELGEEIWNLGLAGSLRDTFSIGDIQEVNTVGKYVPVSDGSLDCVSEDCLSTVLPAFKLQASGMKLISSDFPIHDEQHNLHLKTKWDLVDMEGYGIAYAAAALGKKCRMWKIISDFASPGGRDFIKQNKSRLSEKMAFKILENL
jgi:adenosylhomocysteine nucleosidase